MIDDERKREIERLNREIERLLSEASCPPRILIEGPPGGGPIAVHSGPNHDPGDEHR